MLLFDATHRTLKSVVAQLQQAGRKGRSAALYQQCIEAMERARALNDDAAFVLIAQTFGLVIDQDGYSDSSIAWLTEAAERAQRCGEFGEQSHMLYLIGRAYYSRAEYGVALGYWTSGIDVAARDGDRISWSWCKLGLGQICDALDSPALAVKVFSDLGLTLSTLDSSAQRLPISQRARFEMRLRELRVVNTVNLGVNQLHLGDFSAAVASLRHGSGLAVTAEMEDIASECEVRIAEATFLQGDPALALALLVPAQAALEACAHHWGLATLYLLRSQCQSTLGQLPESMHSILKARIAARRANAKHIALRIELENARVAEKSADIADALKSMKLVVALQAELDVGNKSHMLRHLQELAGLTGSLGLEVRGILFGGKL